MVQVDTAAAMAWASVCPATACALASESYKPYTAPPVATGGTELSTFLILTLAQFDRSNWVSGKMSFRSEETLCEARL